MKTLLVTFTFGQRYEELFALHFRASVVGYCLRHGYEFRQVRSPLDGFRAATRGGGVLAQKLLVATLEFGGEYDAVVWLDSDVYVTEDAPDIVAACPDTGVVCGTNQNAQFNERVRLYNQLSHGYEQTGSEWYADRGIDFDADDVLQSGVLVFRPKHHSQVCSEIYEATIRNEHYRRHGEDQPFFSYEFLRRGLVHFLDWEFNAVWPLHFNFVSVGRGDDAEKRAIMSRLLFISHFVHFTSAADVSLLDSALEGYRDLKSRVAPRVRATHGTEL